MGLHRTIFAAQERVEQTAINMWWEKSLDEMLGIF